MTDPFRPIGSTTKDATTTSAAHQIPGGGGEGEKNVRLVREDNTSRVWIKFGSEQDMSVTTSNGMELLAGVVETFGLRGNEDFFAIITDTGTCEVNVTSGLGI